MVTAGGNLPRSCLLSSGCAIWIRCISNILHFWQSRCVVLPGQVVVCSTEVDGSFFLFLQTDNHTPLSFSSRTLLGKTKQGSLGGTRQTKVRRPIWHPWREGDNANKVIEAELEIRGLWITFLKHTCTTRRNAYGVSYHLSKEWDFSETKRGNSV